MFGQLLGQGPAPARRRVDCVVYGDLTVFMVEPRVNVLAAPLEDLLPQNDGSRGGVGEEVVLWDGTFGANSGTTVIA